MSKVEENIYFKIRKEMTTDYRFQNADSCHKHCTIQKTKYFVLIAVLHISQPLFYLTLKNSLPLLFKKGFAMFSVMGIERQFRFSSIMVHLFFFKLLMVEKNFPQLHNPFAMFCAFQVDGQIWWLVF